MKIFGLKNIYFWFFLLFAFHVAHSDTYVLSTSRTSYTEHQVKGGGNVTTISNTYTVNVPSGYTAKVTVTRIPSKEEMVNCDTATINQYVNGTSRSVLNQTIEISSTSTISLSVSATPASYTETYIDYYYSNGTPHYNHRIKYYTTYYATCVYNISVSYYDGSKKLLVTSSHQVTTSSDQNQGQISVSANVDWSVKTDASWITLGTKTKLASESWKQNYTLAKNNSIRSRTGKITFSATYVESVVVTITQEADSDITGRELEISGNGTIAAGGSATYSCNIVYSSGEKEKITPAWSLSSSTYASIDSNGKVVSTNNKLNDIQINVKAAYTYKGNQVTGTFPVTLSAPNLKGLSIAGENHILKYGQETYYCIGTFSYGDDKEVSASWTLEDVDSRYVSVTSNGTVINKNSTVDPINVTLKATYRSKSITKTVELAPDILDVPIVAASRNGLEGKVKVIWSPIKDGTYYRVFLNDKETPLCGWTKETGDYSFTHVTNGAGIYYVAVASDASGAHQSFSDGALGIAKSEWDWVPAPEELSYSDNSASGGGVSLQWQRSGHGKEYMLCLLISVQEKGGYYTGNIKISDNGSLYLAGYPNGGYESGWGRCGKWDKCYYSSSDKANNYPAVYSSYQYIGTSDNEYTVARLVDHTLSYWERCDIVPSEMIMPNYSGKRLLFVPPVQTVIASTTFSDRIRVAWPVRYTAQYYTVTRTDSETGKTIVVAEDLTDDCFIDTNVKSGVEYTYSVTGNSVSSSNLKFVSESVESNVGKLDGTAVNAQTIDLRNGWNWVSFQTLPASHKVGEVLGTTEFTANDAIQSSTGSSRFNGASWIPSTFTVEYGKLYMVYVSKPVSVTLTGAESGATSLTVTAGWNWIANPATTAVTPAQLRHSAGWTAGDRIQATNGTVTYTGSAWVPSTGFSLEPGKGYQIYSAKAGTIAF